jgi:hypothetical protein
MKIKCIVMVHPTFLLAENFIFEQVKKQGYKIFSILTSCENWKIDPEVVKQNSDFYLQTTDNPENDLAMIKQFVNKNNIEPLAFINGIDATLYYTDYLQKKILGYDIDLSFSKKRLNKFEVNEELKKNGVNYIPSLEIECLNDLTIRIDEINQLGWPLIAKPSEDTAASSNVEMIKDINQLSSYLARTLNSFNLYYPDKEIKKIILQKYLDPALYQEVVFDFVSFNGQHYPSGLMEYQTIRIEGYPIRRYNQFRCFDELEGVGDVLNYVTSILNILKVKFGCTHNEVFWNRKEHQFYLIESNNRMAGNANNEAYQFFYGSHSLDLLLQLIQGKNISSYTNKKISNCFIMAIYNHFVEEASSINTKEIKSVKKIIHFRNKKKLPIGFYKNFSRAIHISAALLLANDDLQILNQDRDEIIKREATGDLFK